MLVVFLCNLQLFLETEGGWITINDDFFEENQQEENPAEVSKIKIGEEEFDPEEAQRLVQLGKIGKEAEEKYNTSLDKVWPDYTRKSQELAKIEKEREERERQALADKQQSGAELSSEERAKLVREQLKQYNVLFEDEYQARFDNDYRSRREAERLLDKVEDTVREAKEKYGIETDNKKILNFMQVEQEYNPTQAFRKLYEPQIKFWEEKQLQEARPQGIVTDPASTAGAKQPAATPTTRANLMDRVLESLNQGS